MSEEFPILSNEYVIDPHRFWKNLRNTNPIFWDEEYGFWVITEYDDIVDIAKNTSEFSSRFGPAGGLHVEASKDGKENSGVGFLPMIQDDPPEHSRIRSLFAKAFTPKRIELMESDIQQIAKQLVCDILQKSNRGESLDLFEDFANPLPVLVIAKMMGIPSSERHRMRVWSDSIGIGTGESFSLEQKIGSQTEMTECLSRIIEQRRCNPEDDLITAMVQASEATDKLHPSELLGLCKLLWIAGNETTSNLISNGAIFLKENPSILERIQKDKSLIPDFVEELLRYESPVNGLFRTATRDIEYKGFRIKEGQSIWLMFSSGSRDAKYFVNGEQFDLQRKHNNHLAFGKGIHFCMGSALARLEARIAFEELIELLPTANLLIEQGKRIPIPVLRGWLKIPMSLKV